MSSRKSVKLGEYVSARQRELLIAFMEGHPFLVTAACALGQKIAERRQALWSELAALLNVEGPAIKTAEQWQGYWRKEVFLSRKDAAAVSASQSGTGGGRIIQLLGTSTATGVCKPFFQPLDEEHCGSQTPSIGATVPQPSSCTATSWTQLCENQVSDRETLLQRVADDYARGVAQSAETNEVQYALCLYGGA
ncbi:hypothetical protein HPB49_005684 [Dermacentor silvarum]|uniref:Uncharacterized protein n=1 Tax=Dermacentor silvarum TaxID=543639 RepID=A0ACB8D2Y9_DERSI|nr:hypothetical protein HPB49_005684 [Dermacentor silvarum]